MSEAKPGGPVRIKLYGLFPTTKRRYLVQVVAAGLMICFLLLAWGLYRREVRDRLAGIDAPLLGLAVRVWDLVPWIVLGVLALQVIEAFFAFRAFARLSAPARPSPNQEPPP